MDGVSEEIISNRINELREVIIKIDSAIHSVVNSIQTKIEQNSIIIADYSNNLYTLEITIKHYSKQIKIDIDDVVSLGRSKYKKNLLDITENEYKEVIFEIIKTEIIK